jgi:hypothetical protein
VNLFPYYYELVEVEAEEGFDFCVLFNPFPRSVSHHFVIKDNSRQKKILSVGGLFRQRRIFFVRKNTKALVLFHLFFVGHS